MKVSKIVYIEINCSILVRMLQPQNYCEKSNYTQSNDVSFKHHIAYLQIKSDTFWMLHAIVSYSCSNISL